MGTIAAAPERSPRSAHLALALVRIALIAGSLDITDNLVFNHFRAITPSMVFQYIASGLVGHRAFAWGLKSVALGVALHYLIALIWTMIFFAASRRLALPTRRPVVSGLLYGVVVYLVMTFVVVPHSQVGPAHSVVTVANRINAILALLFCIGLAISLQVARLSRGPH